MKKNSIPQFVGVITSFIAIWLVNDVFMVGNCLDIAGTFNYRTGECLLVNGDVQTSPFGKSLILIYFFMGLLIALAVSFLVRKVFNMPYDNNK